MHKTPLLYGLVKIWVRGSLPAYFKHIQINGLHLVPQTEPIILVANHQNAFLDAMAIATYLTRPVYFIARSDVFKKPIAAKLLGALNLMPIYRQRDNVDTITLNKPIFEAVARILQKNGAIIIFPEGNQERKRNLRPLQKGFARMAFGAAEISGPQTNLKIVPVGINYSHHLNARGELYVEVGEPLSLSDYYPAYVQNAQKTLKQLADDLSPRMQELIIHIPASEYYNTIDYLRTLYCPVLVQQYGLPNTLENRHKIQQQIVKTLENLRLQNPPAMQQLEDEVYYLQSTNTKPQISAEVFAKKPMEFGVMSLRFLLMVLLAPLALFGIINHLPAALMPRFVISRFVKDLNFLASIKILAAMCSFTLLYLIQTFLVGWFTGSVLWALIYLLSMPVCGRIVFFCKDSWAELIQQWHYRRLSRQPNAATMKGYRQLVNTLNALFAGS